MLRVRNNSCEVHPDFQSVFRDCYGTYSAANEDTEPFGNGNNVFTDDEA